jgi:G3E family GTPase
MAFASLFVPQGDAAHSLPEVARLTATVVTITPDLLLDALVHRRPTADSFSPCFIAEQLEFASIVFLQGDQNDAAFRLAGEIVLALNPRARVFEFSQDNLEQVLNGPGAFDFAAALEDAGWRRLIESDHANQQHGEVRAFAYHARKPFHPGRFWNLLQQGFPGVFRAKGFFWLASRMDFAGGLNLAGTEFHCASAGNWWAARDDHAREFHMPARTRKEWKEPFGDRRQALAFMGVKLNPDSLRTQLDSCILTDSEGSAGAAGWQDLMDPFPSWSSHHHHDHEHECDHDHEAGEHDCCHH